MAEQILQIQHLSKSFGANQVLKDVDFQVNVGDVTCIIGASGSGKSTLLRCINLLETPSGGEILFHGESILTGKLDASAYRAKVGMVFQSFNLFNNLSVLDNCMVGQVKVLKRPKEEARKIAMSFLEKVGMAPYINAKPRQISGGQKQRVAIARALAMGPEVLLFDEPTSALDPGMIGEVQAVIRMLAKSGITMMIVTHEMDFARKIASRVLFMDEGGIYEEGTPKEIFEHPQKPNTIKFIKRLTSLTYKIETVDYDFTEAYDELQQYAEKLLIENERISDLQIALEEIVVNNIMEMTDEPQVLVRVDYSEKLDLLTLSIRYQGEHHDPKDSDNELFLEMLDEPTTDVLDQIVEPPFGIYNNLIQINFRWEEA